MSEDKVTRWKLRVEAQLLGDARPFLVSSVRVFPTGRPEAAKVIPLPRENPYTVPFGSDLARHKGVRE